MAVSLFLLPLTSNADFTTQFTAVSKNAASESEESILPLIQSGIASNLPPQAASLARDWLRQNTPKNPALLYHAARATELTGDAAAAVALYQQFLRQADPASPETSDAITAVHTLLAQYLGQPDFAYSFAAANLDRFITNPQFRQWDTWFLTEARRRNDSEPLAARLLAIVKSGTHPDAIIARHDVDLDWLLTHIRTRRYDIPEHRIPESLATTIKSLAEALTPIDPEYAKLLGTITAIRAYNMARLDGQETSPPLAEAKSLLEKFPHHALFIQTEWAGGNTSPHYRSDPKKYYPDQAEQKFAPVLAALPKLDPVAQTQLLQSWSPGHYATGPEIIPAEKLTEIFLKNPTLINKTSGPTLNLDWEKIPEENLAALAAVLIQNPSPAAALIHARIAAGPEKDLSKAIETLLGTHAWRINPADIHSHADRLWHLMGRPDGNQRRDQEIARAKQLAATITAANPPPTAPLDQRLQNIRALLNDLKSNTPKTPGALWRIRRAIASSPEAAPELLRDTSPIAALLIREAITTGITGPDGRKLDDASLEPILRARLTEQLAKNTIDPWLATTWLNLKFPLPEKDTPYEPLDLLTKLTASPSWKTLPAATHRAARTAFGEAALTPAQLTHIHAAAPARLCAPILALTPESDPAAVAIAVKQSLTNLDASPVRRDLIGLENIPATAFADPPTLAQLIQIAHPYRSFQPTPAFGTPFFTALRQNPDPAHLIPAAAYLWRHIEIHHREYPAMITFIGTLADDHPAALVPLAAWMRLTIARHKGGHTYFNREDIPTIDAMRGRALTALGLITIPVPPTHPAYPIYQAQSDWIIGNEDSAWKSLDENWDAFIETHRVLSLDFLMWAVELTVISGDRDRQETLVTSMVTWAAEEKSPLSTSEKARVEIALGDVALQRGQVTQAEQIFTRVQKNEAYLDTPQRNTAALRRIRSLLAAKDHDGALEIIADLEAQRIPGLWAPLRLARAEVFFDMERFTDAGDDVRSVLQREPGNADALLLLGQVQIKNRRYIEASALEIGSATESPYLVPGENLKVTLNDPGLAISGSGIDIEVVVWTTSDDRETFFLRRFGDEKTRFRGEIPTSLGPPTPGDDTLQVTGSDEVFYAYSEEFRRRVNLEEEMRGGPITVASDAMLMASARQLLTAAEQRIADLEAEISTGENINLADLDPATRARLASQATEPKNNAAAQATVVKPGNPVHVRVIDPDRSRSTSPDELIVSAATSSGDSIASITLRETGPHTGWFEGSIPTAPAPPVAFSPKSEPGRNPNSVISPRDDYPAWQPIAEANAVHEFTIDLNDRANLGEMTLTTPAADGRITRFALQTANRHGAWQTVARHPATPSVPEKSWHPSVTVVRQDGDRALRNARHTETPLTWLQEHLDREAHIRDEPTVATAKNVPGIAEAFPADIPELLGQKERNKWQTLGLVHRFTAWFHEPESTTRRFDINLGNNPGPADFSVHQNQIAQKTGFILAINGRQIAETDANKLEGEINLRPGLHRLDLWAVGWSSNIGYGRMVSLRTNLDPANPTAMVECPPAFFDPANFPPNILERTNGSATITPSGSGDAFTIAFAPDSQARLIRLLLPAYQGPAPAINRITLNSKDGRKILPTAADYATLRQNDTLEILPDDTVSIRYTDDRPVTRNLDQHERFLRAAFTDATLEFADIEPRFSEKHGEHQPFYERLIRFNHGEPLSIVVRDGDMDTTPEPDTLTLSLRVNGGTPREFTATETGPASGIFRLLATPTPNAPAAENEFQIPAGGTLTVTYLDRENTRPGVPTERIATIEHAKYTTPVIHLAHATVKPLAAADGRNQAITHGFTPRNSEPNNNRSPVELVRTRWQIDHQWHPAANPPESAIHTVHGQPLSIKIDAPHLALRANSAIKVYAQTSTGRAAGQSNATFDINTPGTIEVEAALRSKHGHLSVHHPRAGFPPIPIYSTSNLAESEPTTNTQSLLAVIPLIADSLPPYGVVTEEERKEMILQAADSRSFTVPSANRTALVVRPGDTIHIGIQSTDPTGKTTWITAAATVITHPVFDIMEDDARETKTAAYVGETLNLRVIDLGADLTDAPDTVEVLLQAKSGARTRIELRETAPHSGIFTARPTLGFTENGGPLAEDHNIRQLGFPVTYGDTVASRYTAANGLQTDIATVTISKGADGALTPFSKTYDDPETAMRTQFSLAEAYLELSRRYRQLNEISLADQNALTARQLLASVADQFTEPDTRAHAEYLLGQLTLQEALATDDPATKEIRFRAALSRFMTVTGSFSETLHASNAQYRIATIYEALGENDVAAQEYVKLAYKYPQSEFLATSMGRLGSHFLRRASEYEEQSKTLLAKAEAESDLDAEHQGTAMAKMAEREYLNTARIFGRLSDRFPSHELAAQAGIRAGQAYMRATHHRDAVSTFLNVANNPTYDGPEIRAQAMYWAGMNYIPLREQMAAFAIFQRVTYDFPESQWAAFSRAQLSSENMLQLGTKLELQRLEADQ